MNFNAHEILNMKIVVLDGKVLNPGDLSWDGLKALGDVTIYDRTSKEEMLTRCESADILITNKTPIRKEILEKLPTLKYIGVLATGYNIVDVEYATSKNIIVTNIPAYSTDSVVQLIFALLLELCHSVQKHSDLVKEECWVKCSDFAFWRFPLVELAGKTMGIIGFGSIGIATAKVANAFGMKVMVYTRTIKEEFKELVTFCSKEELFTNSDVISLSAPLTKETEGIVNKKYLSMMKKTAFLINTSRGPLVIEQDLANALNNGDIAAAAVDVLSKEPPTKDNPLLTVKNIIITPHIAWATFEARKRLMNIAIDNVRKFLEGNPVNVVKE